jgi:S1-C subfamily serine protease
MGPRSLAIAGAELTKLNAGLRQLVGVKSPGIFVVNVGEGSPANTSGLLPGDVILKADTFVLADPGDLLQVLNEANRSITLRIVRNKQPKTVVLRW